MFTAALFTRAKILKQPKCPLTEECDKMCGVYTHTHTHTHTHMYICIYIYIYIYIYVQWNTTQP